MGNANNEWFQNIQNPWVMSITSIFTFYTVHGGFPHNFGKRNTSVIPDIMNNTFTNACFMCACGNSSHAYIKQVLCMSLYCHCYQQLRWPAPNLPSFLCVLIILTQSVALFLPNSLVITWKIVLVSMAGNGWAHCACSVLEASQGLDVRSNKLSFYTVKVDLNEKIAKL